MANVASIPIQASLTGAISTHINYSAVKITSIQAPAQTKGIEAPAVVQAPVQVYQYTRSVYAVIVNGLAAQQDITGNTVGPALARIIQNGPSGGPPPPAGVAAGIPVAPHATNDQVTASTIASLRSLAGNSSSIFGG